MFKTQINSSEDTVSSESIQEEPLVQFSAVNTKTI